MKHGYARVSTQEQSLERQLQTLEAAGCEQVHVEKASGKNFDRPVLQALLGQLQAGDVLVVHELDRLGRSMVQMLLETERLMERGVNLITLDGRINTETTDPMIVKLVVSILGYAAELERKAILKRTREGLAVARANGVVVGRKRQWTEGLGKTVAELRQQGMGYGAIATRLGITDGKVRRILHAVTGGKDGGVTKRRKPAPVVAAEG